MLRHKLNENVHVACIAVFSISLQASESRAKVRGQREQKIRSRGGRGRGG